MTFCSSELLPDIDCRLEFVRLKPKNKLCAMKIGSLHIKENWRNSECSVETWGLH